MLHPSLGSWCSPCTALVYFAYLRSTALCVCVCVYVLLRRREVVAIPAWWSHGRNCSKHTDSGSTEAGLGSSLQSQQPQLWLGDLEVSTFVAGSFPGAHVRRRWEFRLALDFLHAGGCWVCYHPFSPLSEYCQNRKGTLSEFLEKSLSVLILMLRIWKWSQKVMGFVLIFHVMVFTSVTN